ALSLRIVCEATSQDHHHACGFEGYAQWASRWCAEMHSSSVTSMAGLSRFVPQLFACLTVRPMHRDPDPVTRSLPHRPPQQEIEKQRELLAHCSDVRQLAVSTYRHCMEERTNQGPTFCDLELEEWQRILSTIELAETTYHPKEMTAALIKQCACG